MKPIQTVFATLVLASIALVQFPVHADDEQPNVFVVMCEKSPDGKITRAQVMAMAGKAFDKADTRKEGKIDKKQAEVFFKSFTRESGG
ncbi:hypothetical protein DSM104443_02344 [Usitatibacter rugosus]|uniref:EF-hand domain-containing protein n=1 Tax=Usitatibacter rugosus TaxID=2732067 RepID=A0A6M4GVD6_9PROT|nr:hypothetical protein [Usitatibacter rugosus]QJR11271.1 hypothetical protein DSM104443_02344 [Usitatibacter rugosus]